MLTALGLWGELFHTAVGTAFADIPLKGHRETWPLRSKRFRTWLRRCHYEATGEAASPAVIRSALDLFSIRGARPVRWPRARGPHPDRHARRAHLSRSRR